MNFYISFSNGGCFSSGILEDLISRGKMKDSRPNLVPKDCNIFYIQRCQESKFIVFLLYFLQCTLITLYSLLHCCEGFTESKLQFFIIQRFDKTSNLPHKRDYISSSPKPYRATYTIWWRGVELQDFLHQSNEKQQQRIICRKFRFFSGKISFEKMQQAFIMSSIHRKLVKSAHIYQ